MDKVKPRSDRWKLPRRRSMDDFLYETSRFQLPNFKDLEKWSNRVVNNLVYYQTNYLYICIAITLIVSLLHPMKMMIGVISMMAIWGECAYLFSEDEALLDFKKSYPQVGIVIAVIFGSFVVYTINSLLFALCGVLLSLIVILIHASLRLRHMKNKIVNKIEGMGLERTPMGIILSYIGMKEESFT
ncbi:PRA1 family protein 3 [Habropoda laboriosa]|uniref:PRA1 family protein n=1 Tax=Habropoda laboriosa TaxID=597456 RepID=A0A0L7QL42_9HYME|nr:PRA1 family protein 3 [Habropoda laboriosa]